MKDLITRENEQLQGLEESKAKQIKAVFAPMMDDLIKVEDIFNKAVNLEITPETCVNDKRLRLDIAKIRINADKVRKVTKEEFLRGGQAVDGLCNIIKYAVVSKEEKLKEREEHFQRIEAEKIKQLQIDRSAELEKYDSDGEFVDLGNMPDEVWKNYLAGVKNNFESIREAERKAEEDRIEVERINSLGMERRESIYDLWQFLPEENKSENFGTWAADMWDELVNYLNLTKSDYDKEQAEIKADNERLRIENEKAEKKRIADKKKADADRKKQDAKLKAEREAREKLEREAAEKEAAEVAERKKAEKAPDKEKLLSVAQKLRNTKTTVKSPEAKKALEDAAVLIEKIAEVM